MFHERAFKCKKRLIGIGIILIGVVVIIGIFGIQAFYPTIEVNDEKSFSIDGITSLQVDMTKEHIRVIQAQTNEVKVHYHGTSKQNLKLSSKTNNGTVVIGSTRTTNLMRDNLYVDIYIPENYNTQLILHTTSGDVTSEKVQSGAITINTTSGKIALNDCAGNINLKTSSGNIFATYNNLDKQDIHIAATSGNIQLKLPSTAEFLLEAKTSTGKLHSDFPVTNENKKMEGQIGNKSNNVVLQTSTGNINLLSDF